jgi:predicted MFS family arabinose efflux permease
VSRRLALLLFAVAWGTNHFVPMLLVYRASLGLTPVDLGILFGVYAVGLLPGLLFGGPLSDRVGRRAVVLPASVVALAGTAILSFGGTAGFPVLLVGRLVVGLGSGATFSAGTAWVQDLARDLPPGTGARRAAVALSSGFGGGPLVTGVLAQWLPWPMRLPYAIQALLLASAIAAAASGDGGAAPATTRPAQARAADRSSGTVIPPGFVREVAFVAPWVFVFPSVSHAVLPGLVREQVGSLRVVFAGLVTGLTLLTAVLIQPALKPWRPRSAATFGLAVGTVGLVVGAGAAAVARPVGVLLAAPLLGLGYGGCLIAGLRFVEANAAPSARGGLTGIFYALTYIGFASPLAIAAIAAHTGEVGGVLVCAILSAATLAWTVVDDRRARNSPATRSVID